MVTLDDLVVLLHTADLNERTAANVFYLLLVEEILGLPRYPLKRPL